MKIAVLRKGRAGLKKPTWIGTGGVLPEKYGEFLLDFVLVLSNIYAVYRTIELL